MENVLVAHSRVKSGSPPLIVDWREVWWGTSGHRVASASAESSVFQLKGGDLKKRSGLGFVVMLARHSFCAVDIIKCQEQGRGGSQDPGRGG